MRRGFSLLEVLVAIIIVAFLSAIVAPVLVQAKEAAKRTSCLINGKQIGSSLYLYAADFDNTLMMANYPAGNSGQERTVFAFRGGQGIGQPAWADLLQPYAKSTEIFHCPSDYTGRPRQNSVEGEPLSYALNYYFFRQPNNISRMTQSGGNLGEVENPASKIFVAETGSGAGRDIVRPDISAGFERHSKGSIYIYADTHAHYHVMPRWWKQVPAAVWRNPVTAAQQPCPQWFPWVSNGREQW